MLFASSRDALRKALVGIAVEIQATELSEISHETSTCPTSSTSDLTQLFLVLEKASKATR